VDIMLDLKRKISPFYGKENWHGKSSKGVLNK